MDVTRMEVVGPITSANLLRKMARNHNSSMMELAKINKSNQGLMVSKRLKKSGDWRKINRAMSAKAVKEITPKERPSLRLPPVRKIDLWSYLPRNDKMMIMGTI